MATQTAQKPQQQQQKVSIQDAPRDARAAPEQRPQTYQQRPQSRPEAESPAPPGVDDSKQIKCPHKYKNWIPPHHLPSWEKLPLDWKMPMPPQPKGAVLLYTTDIGVSKRKNYKESDFDNNDPNIHLFNNDYISLHDRQIAPYFEDADARKVLQRHGLITSDGKVLCGLKEYNDYRRYLDSVNLTMAKSFLDEQKQKILKEVKAEDSKERASFQKKRQQRLDRSAQDFTYKPLLDLSWGDLRVMERKREEKKFLDRNDFYYKMHAMQQWTQDDIDRTQRVLDRNRKKEEEKQRKLEESWIIRKQYQAQRIELDELRRQAEDERKNMRIARREQMLAELRGKQEGILQRLIDRRRKTSSLGNEEYHRKIRANLMESHRKYVLDKWRKTQAGKDGQPVPRSQWSVETCLAATFPQETFHPYMENYGYRPPGEGEGAGEGEEDDVMGGKFGEPSPRAISERGESTYSKGSTPRSGSISPREPKKGDMEMGVFLTTQVIYPAYMRYLQEDHPDMYKEYIDQHGKPPHTHAPDQRYPDGSTSITACKESLTRLRNCADHLPAAEVKSRALADMLYEILSDLKQGKFSQSQIASLIDYAHLILDNKLTPKELELLNSVRLELASPDIPVSDLGKAIAMEIVTDVHYKLVKRRDETSGMEYTELSKTLSRDIITKTTDKLHKEMQDTIGRKDGKTDEALSGRHSATDMVDKVLSKSAQRIVGDVQDAVQKSSDEIRVYLDDMINQVADELLQESDSKLTWDKAQTYEEVANSISESSVASMLVKDTISKVVKDMSGSSNVPNVFQGVEPEVATNVFIDSMVLDTLQECLNQVKRRELKTDRLIDYTAKILKAHAQIKRRDKPSPPSDPEQSLPTGYQNITSAMIDDIMRRILAQILSASKENKLNNEHISKLVKVCRDLDIEAKSNDIRCVESAIRLVLNDIGADTPPTLSKHNWEKAVSLEALLLTSGSGKSKGSSVESEASSVLTYVRNMKMKKMLKNFPDKSEDTAKLSQTKLTELADNVVSKAMEKLLQRYMKEETPTDDVGKEKCLNAVILDIAKTVINERPVSRHEESSDDEHPIEPVLGRTGRKCSIDHTVVEENLSVLSVKKDSDLQHIQKNQVCSRNSFRNLSNPNVQKVRRFSSKEDEEIVKQYSELAKETRQSLESTDEGAEHEDRKSEIMSDDDEAQDEDEQVMSVEELTTNKELDRLKALSKSSTISRINRSGSRASAEKVADDEALAAETSSKAPSGTNVDESTSEYLATTTSKESKIGSETYTQEDTTEEQGQTASGDAISKAPSKMSKVASGASGASGEVEGEEEEGEEEEGEETEGQETEGQETEGQETEGQETEGQEEEDEDEAGETDQQQKSSAAISKVASAASARSSAMSAKASAPASAISAKVSAVSARSKAGSETKSFVEDTGEGEEEEEDEGDQPQMPSQGAISKTSSRASSKAPSMTSAKAPSQTGSGSRGSLPRLSSKGSSKASSKAGSGVDQSRRSSGSIAKIPSMSSKASSKAAASATSARVPSQTGSEAEVQMSGGSQAGSGTNVDEPYQRASGGSLTKASSKALSKTSSQGSSKAGSGTNVDEPYQRASGSITRTSSKASRTSSKQAASATSARIPSTTSAREPSATSARIPSTTSAREPSATSARIPSTTSAREPSTTSAREASATSARVPSQTGSQAEGEIGGGSQAGSGTNIDEPGIENPASATSARIPSTTSAREPSATSARVPSNISARQPSTTSESGFAPAAETEEEVPATEEEEDTKTSYEEETVSRTPSQAPSQTASRSSAVGGEGETTEASQHSTKRVESPQDGSGDSGSEDENVNANAIVRQKKIKKSSSKESCSSRKLSGQNKNNNRSSLNATPSTRSASGYGSRPGSNQSRSSSRRSSASTISQITSEDENVNANAPLYKKKIKKSPSKESCSSRKSPGQNKNNNRSFLNSTPITRSASDYGSRPSSKQSRSSSRQSGPSSSESSSISASPISIRDDEALSVVSEDAEPNEEEENLS